jgi:hypothetical protein
MREVYCELTVSEEETAAEGPFIVRDPSAVIATATAPDPDASGDVTRRPAEAARTRDGEIDPPAAAP